MARPSLTACSLVVAALLATPALAQSIFNDFPPRPPALPRNTPNVGWLFPDPVAAFASGWMRIRGNRRRRALDRGFVLSDHADWGGILAAVRASGAERVWTTHGFAAETTSAPRAATPAAAHCCHQALSLICWCCSAAGVVA